MKFNPVFVFKYFLFFIFLIGVLCRKILTCNETGDDCIHFFFQLVDFFLAVTVANRKVSLHHESQQAARKFVCFWISSWILWEHLAQLCNQKSVYRSGKNVVFMSCLQQSVCEHDLEKAVALACTKIPTDVSTPEKILNWSDMLGEIQCTCCC